MPFQHKFAYRGATFGIWRVEETAEELRSMLADGLPYDRELEALHAPSRKLEYLAVRVLLRTLLGEELSVGHYPSGKPFLVGDRRRITISHTHGYAAAGVHPAAEVGIDIERRSERVRRASPRFMRDDEFPDYACLPEHDQLTGLLLHWCAKETVYKMMNAGGVDFQEHLLVRPFKLQQEGVMMCGELFSPERKRYAVSYMTGSDFVCTYSVDDFGGKAVET